MTDDNPLKIDDNDVYLLERLSLVLDEFLAIDGARLNVEQARIIIAAIVGHEEITRAGIEQKLNLQQTLVLRTMARFTEPRGDHSSKSMFYYRIDPIDNKRHIIHLTDYGFHVTRRIIARLRGEHQHDSDDAGSSAAEAAAAPGGNS